MEELLSELMGLCVDKSKGKVLYIDYLGKDKMTIEILERGAIFFDYKGEVKINDEQQLQAAIDKVRAL